MTIGGPEPYTLPHKTARSLQNNTNRMKTAIRRRARRNSAYLPSMEGSHTCDNGRIGRTQEFSTPGGTLIMSQHYYGPGWQAPGTILEPTGLARRTPHVLHARRRRNLARVCLSLGASRR